MLSAVDHVRACVDCSGLRVAASTTSRAVSSPRQDPQIQ